jgi:hypothetical protein
MEVHIEFVTPKYVVVVADSYPQLVTQIDVFLNLPKIPRDDLGIL